MMSDIKNSCEQEVIELHQFFEDWFAGRLPKTEAAFARVGASMADAFTIVGPNGRLTPHADLLPGLFSVHGSRTDPRIWIENFTLHQQHGDLLLVTYEEWQTIDGETTSRLSSALFRVDASTPHGVRWQHVHETWIK